MPDILKMKEMADTLERTAKTMDELADKLSASMDRMTGTLEATRETIERMANSVDAMATRTSSSMEMIATKFDTLVDTLVVVGKEFKNPLDPKTLVSGARDLLVSSARDMLKK